MRNLAELNINEGGRPVKRAPPSDNELAAFENHFRVRVPAPFVQLLRYANGGHPELDAIEPLGDSREEHWSVNSFLHLTADEGDQDGLWRAMEVWQPILGSAALPIAEDGGGNVFFVDTSSATGAVKVCIHDEDFAIQEIAPSFEAFVDHLSADPDYI